MSHSHSDDDDHFLDDDTAIVPSTQLSPGTFISQVSTRLGIRSFALRRADAADTISNNKLTDRHYVGGQKQTGLPVGMRFVPPNVANFHSSQSDCTDIDFALPSVAYFVSCRKFTAALAHRSSTYLLPIPPTQVIYIFNAW